jgi:hypothetical protein
MVAKVEVVKLELKVSEEKTTSFCSLVITEEE